MKIYRETIPARRITPVAQAAVGSAAEIKVWGPRAMATVLWEIGSQFELATGHKLDVDSALADSYVDRLNAGERFDVFVGMPALVDELIEHGTISAGNRTPLARCGIGVGVRAGAHRPDISSVEAFRSTLLEAKSIAYLNVGGGVHIATIIDRLGIADAIRPKVTRPNTDIVSELVAKGDIELGMVITTQILTTSGVQFVGPLPSELQSHVMFVGGVSATTHVPDAACELLRFLAGPIASAAMKSQGMEPAEC